jgi:hypothetical protein
MPDSSARPEEYGAGVIDAYEVVQAKAGAGPVAPPPPVSAALP